MDNKLNICNVENYNKTFEYENTKIYVESYVELINEYMLFVVENMIIQDETYLLFLIRRGIETIMHCFKIMLMYTKNLDLTIFYCKKALYYYIEFIGQISDVSLHHSYLQLNSKDATLFVYKKTIYDINNAYRKTCCLTEKENEFLSGIANTITLFNDILLYLLQKERLKYAKKESIIRFSIEKSSSIINKLFTKKEPYLTEKKAVLCLFFFQILKTYYMVTIKYSNICEIFIKKLRKYSKDDLFNIKTHLKEKLYNPQCEDKLAEMSALRFVNWLLNPL